MIYIYIHAQFQPNIENCKYNFCYVLFSLPEVVSDIIQDDL